MKRSLNLLAGLWFVISATVFAGNGPFGLPSEASYKTMPAKERALYEARLAQLIHPEFVNKSHYKSASFYVTPGGVGEFYGLVDEVTELLPRYARFVGIGRSGAGLTMFLRGYTSTTTEIGDLPFSYADVWTPVSDEERAALRRHLTNNGLTPQNIAESTKPILLFDFVYSGQGSGKLIGEIGKWAQELGLKDQVKANLHFFGCYPAETIASTHVMSIYYATLKEGLRPAKPTQKEIDDAAKQVSMPGRRYYDDAVGKIYERRISSAFYNYAGTHGPNGQQSLKRDLWKTDLEALPENTFEGQSGDDGHLELYYLRREGERLKSSCPHRLMNGPTQPG